MRSLKKDFNRFLYSNQLAKNSVSGEKQPFCSYRLFYSCNNSMWALKRRILSFAQTKLLRINFHAFLN